MNNNIIKIKDGEVLDARLEGDSILADGYGISPKYVMRNKDIPVYSKAIYAYLSSFAGNKKYCHPRMETIYAELNISKNAFIKYVEVLKEYGFIKVYRIQNENNLYGNNVYEIAMSKSKIRENAENYIKTKNNKKKSKKSPIEAATSKDDSKQKTLNSINYTDIITQKEKDIQELKENGFTELEIYSMSEEKIKQAVDSLRKIKEKIFK
ncbi:helix-turn-helix domain-containing protein [Clostridioides difficile]|nr:helix-turn-helix domain-containing protein [Clostridioides difficile]